MSHQAATVNGHTISQSQKIATPHLGMSDEILASSSVILNRVLSNASLLVIKTKKAHWDVMGPQFYSLHKLWDEQYETLSERTDQIAERIRFLGGFPIGTATGWLEHAVVHENPGRIEAATDAVRELMEDHELVARVLRKNIEELEGKDVGTADFLTQLLQDHEKMSWMLRSFLSGEAVESIGSAPRKSAPHLA